MRNPISVAGAFVAASFAAVAFTALVPSSLHAQTRAQVLPAEMAVSPNYSPGIRVGQMIYASGQLGLRPAAPDTTVGGQTTIALESTRRIFEAAGTSMANAVKCTVFLVDANDFQAMNAAYRSFWPEKPPARSTVVVAALVVAGAKVEIECMAAMP